MTTRWARVTRGWIATAARIAALRCGESTFWSVLALARPTVIRRLAAVHVQPQLARATTTRENS